MRDPEVELVISAGDGSGCEKAGCTELATWVVSINPTTSHPDPATSWVCTKHLGETCEKLLPDDVPEEDDE